MGQALYRKWRPQTFDQVVGQGHIVRTLRYALQTEHVHHAYLFAGPRGTGKTTTARLVAKAVNCLAPVESRPCDQCEICEAISDGRLMDLVEIDAASNTGVDNIREILEKVGFRPAQARYKVYVVDEVHMLSTAAFNALLKTLEEPPDYVIFILATTEVHKIPATVLSRCQRFEFRRIPLNAIVERLLKIATAEEVETEPEALDLIARAATGSMRDAISLFDQMASGGSVNAEYVRTMLGAERREVVHALISAWLDEDLNAGLAVINRAIDGGADPRQLARQTADVLRGLMLMRMGAGDAWAEPTAEERPQLEEMAQQAKPERLVEAVRHFSRVAAERRSGWQPQLPLELAFVEATLVPEPPPAQVIVQAPPEQAEPAAAARRVRRVTPPGRQSQGQSAATASGETTPQAPAAPALTQETVAKVAAHWEDVAQQIQPVSLGALLRDAEPKSGDSEGRLVLGFQHGFHCEKVAQDEHQRRLEEFLSQKLGQQIRVRCVLAKDWQAPPQAPAQVAPQSASPSRPPAQKAAPPARQRPPEPEPAPDEEDILVCRAEEELGAVSKVQEE